MWGCYNDNPIKQHMALDFPNSPVDGQQFTSNNITWTYSSSLSVWRTTSTIASLSSLTGQILYNSLNIPVGSNGITFNASSNTVFANTVNVSGTTNTTNLIVGNADILATLSGANTITTSAFTKANAALPNATGTFAGTITITGNTIATNVIVSGGIQTAANGNYGAAGQVLTSNGSFSTYWSSVAAFPSGTAMLFAQTAAPTGWTKSTTHNDKALRVVSGAASNGGSVAFSTAFASQAVSGTVGSTTLTTTQMPAHAHTAPYGILTCGSAGFVAMDARFGSGATDSAGGGGSHNHTFTGTAINLAVNYVDVIIATKD